MKLLERATNMLLRPRHEWPVVAGEATTIPQLYKGYIAPLAAIYPIASVIGFSVIGISLPLVGSYRIPFGESVRHALFGYALGLVAVHVLALVLNGLAPRFGGRRDRVQALKLAAFAYTPSWLAGLLVVLPWLGVLEIVAAIYSLYLLYIGLPVLMGSPRERRLRYFLSVMAVGIVINVGALVLTGAIVGVPGNRDAGRTAMAPVDACSLLGRAEAEAILGQPVQASPERDGGEGCVWNSVDQQLGTAALLVSVQRGGDARQVFEMTKRGNEAVGRLFEGLKVGGATPVQAVPGLGDEAFLHGLSDGGVLVGTTTLVVRKNDTVLTLTAVTAARKASLDRMKGAAADIVRRI